MTLFRTLLFIALASVVGAGPGFAQSASLFPGLGADNDTPIEVEADALEMTETEDERIAVLTGNVIVTRGATVIRANTITLYSTITRDPAAPPPEPVAGVEAPAGFGAESLRRIVASGNVSISSDLQQATGNEATFDMATQLVTLTGNVRLAQGQNNITGERLVVDLAAGTARVEQGPGGRIRGIFLPGAGGLGP